MRRYYLDQGLGSPPIAIEPPDSDTDEGDYIMYADATFIVKDVEDDVAVNGQEYTILHCQEIEYQMVWDADEDEYN